MIMMTWSHRKAVLLFYRLFFLLKCMSKSIVIGNILCSFISLSPSYCKVSIYHFLSITCKCTSKCIFLTLSYYNITIKVAFEWFVIRVRKMRKYCHSLQTRILILKTDIDLRPEKLTSHNAHTTSSSRVDSSWSTM